jgi:formate C-acetyltransferase
LIAPLEMALNNGRHPLLKEQVGPCTGWPDQQRFPEFEDFWNAFSAQLQFLVEQATGYNNLLTQAHQALRPTPLLSSLMQGCAEKGLDATEGGALYNSSGAACIGLADLVDSLQTIRTLIYEEGSLTWQELRQALNNDFDGDERLLSRINNQVERFGSGSAAALELAQRLIALIHDQFQAQPNARGGHYRPGFWTMSNHVAFGNLSGALPSGRRAGSAFTPGLTPSASASPNLLDNLIDVSQLAPQHLKNNIAFNVKYVPSAHDCHAKAVKHMAAYVRTYCEQGGMQIQFNVVDSKVLQDAVLHPENYRDLLVRISGYNAYFVTLNPDMQQELIERAQYG